MQSKGGRKIMSRLERLKNRSLSQLNISLNHLGRLKLLSEKKKKKKRKYTKSRLAKLQTVEVNENTKSNINVKCVRQKYSTIC